MLPSWGSFKKKTSLVFFFLTVYDLNLELRYIQIKAIGIRDFIGFPDYEKMYEFRKRKVIVI